jgi:hypothetical protein
MFGSSGGGGGQPHRNPMQQAGFELASAIALLTAFVVTPLLLDLLYPSVDNFIANHYGPDMIGFGEFVFGGTVGFIVFSVARSFLLLAMAALTLRAAFAFA